MAGPRESRLLHSLYINVAEAKNLPGLDRGGTSDPFCVVSGFGNGLIVRTPTVYKTCEPFWGSEWTFDVCSQADHINVLVMDEEPSGLSRPIGKFSIPIASLVSGAMRESWYPLFRLSASDDEYVSGLLDIEVTRTLFALSVRLHSGRGLAPKDANGLSDPYARLAVGTVTYKSRTINKTVDPVWGEVFEFDLDAPGAAGADALDVVLFDWDKLSADDFMGSVRITLADLPLNTPVRRWHDVTPRKPGSPDSSQLAEADASLGSVRVKAQYISEVVLDETAYEPLFGLLRESSFALTKLIGVHTHEREPLARSLVHAFAANSAVLELVDALNAEEVALTEGAHVIFRGNSLASKVTDMALKLLGHEYLEDTLGVHVDAIYSSKLGYEVDPSRLGAVDRDRELAANWLHLQALVDAVIEAIFRAGDQCPVALRHIFTRLGALVRARWPDDELVPFTVVTAFLFLRFFCPALLGPKLFSLADEHPEPTVARTLTLVAKSVQNLANLVEFGPKEPYMHDMNPLIVARFAGLRALVAQVSSAEVDETARARIDRQVAGDVLAAGRADYCREMARVHVRVEHVMPALRELGSAPDTHPDVAARIARLDAAIDEIGVGIAAAMASMTKAQSADASSSIKLDSVRRGTMKLERGGSRSGVGGNASAGTPAGAAPASAPAPEPAPAPTPMPMHAHRPLESADDAGEDIAGQHAITVSSAGHRVDMRTVDTRAVPVAIDDGFDDLLRELQGNSAPPMPAPAPTPTRAPASVSAPTPAPLVASGPSAATRAHATAAAPAAADESDEELNAALGIPSRRMDGVSDGSTGTAVGTGGGANLALLPSYSADMMDELSERLFARYAASGPLDALAYESLSVAVRPAFGDPAAFRDGGGFGDGGLGYGAAGAHTGGGSGMMPASFFDFSGAPVAAPARQLDADGFELPRVVSQTVGPMSQPASALRFKGMNVPLDELVADLRASLPVQPKQVSRTYAECFAGRALVDLLVVLAKGNDRATGVFLAQQMLDRRLVRCVEDVSDASQFVDAHVHYQVTARVDETMPRGLAVLLDQVRLNVPRTSKEVRSRYESGFLGADLVSALMTVLCKLKPVRGHAVRVADELFARNIIASITGESAFTDGYAVFYFVPSPVTPDRPQNALETAAEVALYRRPGQTGTAKERLADATEALVAWANAEFAASSAHASTRIVDLDYDLRSGVLLCSLLELLVPTLHIGAVVRRTTNTRAEQLDNLSLVVRELERLGVRGLHDRTMGGSYSGLAVGVNEGELLPTVVILHQLRKHRLL